MVEKQDSPPSPNLSHVALQSLQRITTKILGRLELEPVLESILEGAVDLLAADHGHLYRYSHELDQLIPWIPHRLPEAADLSIYDRGEGAVGTVLATGKTLLVDDYDSWDGRAPNWPFGVTGSLVATEIRAGEELLGVVSVNRSPDAPAYTAASAELLELFASQAAVAITNANAFQAARRSAEELARLYEVSLSVTRELDLSRTLETVLDRVTALLNARSANVRIYDEQKGKLVPLLPFKQSDDIAGIEMEPGEGVSGRAFASGEAVVVNDYDQWEDRSGQYPPGRIARTMAAPLISGDQVTGAIAVDREAREPPFNEHDVRLLSLFANQAASAIANARLFEQSERRGRELQHVFETSLDITGRLDLSQVLVAVIERTTDLAQAVEGEVIIIDPETGLITEFLNHGLQEVVAPHSVHAVGERPTGLDGQVIDRREPVTVDDYDTFPGRVPAIPPGVAGPMVGVPLLHRGQVLGSLSLFRSRGQPPFDRADVRRLTLFANQAAVAVAYARQVKELSELHAQDLERERLQQQIRMASAVQTGFLPDELPKNETFEVAAFWRPALQVGGDFYDSFPLDSGGWGFVIADVSDKGIPAALFMAMARSLFRAQSANNAGPAGVITAVNQEIVRSTHSGMFLTAIFAEYEASTRRLRLSNGGHNRPLLVRKPAAIVETLDLAGMALGVVAEANYGELDMQLEPGDRLLMYTDGITEAINQDGEEYGIERLRTELMATRHLSSEKALDRIKVSVDTYCEGLPPFDDLTCLILDCVA